MSARNAYAWLLVLGFLALVILSSGCTTVDRVWYGCDQQVSWRGWEAEKQCARLVDRQSGAVRG